MKKFYDEVAIQNSFFSEFGFSCFVDSISEHEVNVRDGNGGAWHAKLTTARKVKNNSWRKNNN